MTSRTAERLVRLYPRGWRARYGEEFAALLEQHPFSFKNLANVLWSAGEAHMRTPISHQRNQGQVIGSVWTAWMIAVVAGLILYGMVDDSALLAATNQSFFFAASWKMIQAGCALAILAIGVAGLPIASSIGLLAIRERRRDIYLQIAIPFISIFALVVWIAAVLMFTQGHWAASPWAVTFSRPDWPSDSTRWITGSITAILLLLGCFASSASISRVLRNSDLPHLRLPSTGINVEIKPLSFASALLPWVATGIFVMLAGVTAWGCFAIHLSAIAFHGLKGPLGLSGLLSWIFCVIAFALASAISAKAAWRVRHLSAGR